MHSSPPPIHYCNNLLFGIPDIHIGQLQRLQNSATCLICGTPRYSHIMPVLHALHWLSVSLRIVFKIAVLTFKTIHDMAPGYVCDLVRIRKQECYSLSFAHATHSENKENSMRQSMCLHSPFSLEHVTRPYKSAQSIVKCNSLLKTFLFKQAFGRFNYLYYIFI